MTFAQVKETLNIKSLDLSRCKDKDDKPTEWLRMWNNQQRFAVVLHQDIVAKIKENPTGNKFALKHEVKATETGDNAGLAYDAYTLIWAESMEESL